MVAFVIPGLASSGEKSGTTGEKITLMLGGKFCGNYTEDVEMALKKVSGVKSVDTNSMPGHAVVDVEPGKVKPAQLETAVNGVKGSGWHCKGEVMK
jgi:copper chaperone CopZ